MWQNTENLEKLLKMEQNNRARMHNNYCHTHMSSATNLAFCLLLLNDCTAGIPHPQFLQIDHAHFQPRPHSLQYSLTLPRPLQLPLSLTQTSTQSLSQLFQPPLVVSQFRFQLTLPRSRRIPTGFPWRQTPNFGCFHGNIAGCFRRNVVEFLADKLGTGVAELRARRQELWFTWWSPAESVGFFLQRSEVWFVVID